MDSGAPRLIELTRLTEELVLSSAKGKRLLVGVSGGADSVCLLLCASALRQKGFTVCAAHIRHDLRESAALDEEFVHGLCGRMGVPFESRAVHVPRSGSVEDAARQVRYEALSDIYHSFGADALLLAHHRGDQAETVLMRLIRGCGSEGLSAMSAVSRRGEMLLLRPFLPVSRDALRQALTAAGQPWREDETNADCAYTRNYLRRQILAPLEARFPGTETGLLRSAELLRGEDGFMLAEAEARLPDCACLALPCRFLLCSKVKALHPALARRLIRLFLDRCGTAIGFEKTEEIRALLSDGAGTVNLPGGARLRRIGDRLHYLPAVPPAWTAPEDYLSEVPGPEGFGDGVLTQAVPENLYRQSVLRLPRQGDVFRPFGHAGSQPLRRYLIDRKIDQPFRPFLPLLCVQNVVLWIPGIAASEQARLRPGEAAVCLRLTGRLPWQIDSNQQREDTAHGHYGENL